MIKLLNYLKLSNDVFIVTVAGCQFRVGIPDIIIIIF